MKNEGQCPRAMDVPCDVRDPTRGAVLEQRLKTRKRVHETQTMQVEYNAGFQGVLAGIAQLDLNWYQCKINYGITVKDQTFCAKLRREGG